MSSSDTSSQTLPLERAPGLVLINDTPKGRGIFATKPIPRNTIIDICPVLIFTSEEVTQHTSHTVLDHYTFTWPAASSSHSSFNKSGSGSGSGPPRQAIALGLGSMFNHSRHGHGQNVGWRRDIEREVIFYVALRDIDVGEELCINYGGRLWFQDVDEDGEEGDTEGGMNGTEESANGDDFGRSGLGAIDLVQSNDQGEDKTKMK